MSWNIFFSHAITENWIISADWRAIFFIFLFAMGHMRSEILIWPKHTATKPDGISLDHILRNFNLNRLSFMPSFLEIGVKSSIYSFLDKLHEFLIKTVEKSGSTWQYDVFVKFSSIIDWAWLNAVVDDLIERCSPVLMHKFLLKNRYKVINKKYLPDGRTSLVPKIFRNQHRFLLVFLRLMAYEHTF